MKFVSKNSAEFLSLVIICVNTLVLRHNSICRAVVYSTIGHWKMYIYISRSSALYSYYLSLEINISVSSCSAIFGELMISKYRLHSKNMDLAHECFTRG